MKSWLAISASFHVLLLVAGLIGWVGGARPQVSPDAPLPVELVTIGDITTLSPPPAAPEEDVASEPESLPDEPPPPPPAAAPPPPPVAALEPDAMPLPDAAPEPAPEPTPEPAPSPPKLSAIPVPLSPSARPDSGKDSAFDTLRIAALLDKLPKDAAPKPKPSADAPPAPDSGQAFGDAATLTISEIDAFKLQMRRCWIVPAGAANAGGLAVRIKVRLNPDGTLSQPPRLINTARSLTGDIAFRAAAESAMRAIRKCQPFKMPPEKYSRWSELDLNFNPADMLGASIQP